MDERNIENHIRPLLGELYVDDVSRADIDRLKRAIKDGKKKPGASNRTSFRGGKVVAGGAVVANRCLALLSKMFNLAELWGWRPEHSNPVRHIEKYKEVRRERYLSADEFARLGDALATSAEEGSESRFALAAIRLPIFTGARLGEILTFRWDYVDLEQRLLKLPDSKTGRKLVWLNPPAVETLDSYAADQGQCFRHRRLPKTAPFCQYSESMAPDLQARKYSRRADSLSATFLRFGRGGCRRWLVPNRKNFRASEDINDRALRASRR